MDFEGFRPTDQRRGTDSGDLHRRQDKGLGIGDVEQDEYPVPRERRERVEGEEAGRIGGCGRGRTPEGSLAAQSSRASGSLPREMSVDRSRIRIAVGVTREDRPLSSVGPSRARSRGLELPRGDESRPAGRFESATRSDEGSVREAKRGEREEPGTVDAANFGTKRNVHRDREQTVASAHRWSERSPAGGFGALANRGDRDRGQTSDRGPVRGPRGPIGRGSASRVYPAPGILRFVAPVGCSDCSSVAFCGRGCRDAAMASYHKYECKILALLIGSGMSVLSMLALRMVTQRGSTGCYEIYRALTQRDVATERVTACTACNACTEASDAQTKRSKSAKRRSRRKKLRDSRREGGARSEEDAEQREGKENRDAGDDLVDDADLRVYDLVTHENRRTAKDFFERSLMAAFLLKCLQRVGFFEKPTKDEETPDDREVAVASLLLKHLQLLQFNAHEVFETRLGTEHRFRGSRPVYLGVAIYPTVARFNHDCYPAVTRYFVGRCIVIRATRSLRPGDVVAENYGPIFTKRTLEERRRTLAGRYWFRCECTACRENWPRFEALTNDHVRLRCPTEGCSKLHRRLRDVDGPVECSSCRRKVHLKRSLDCVRECERLYARGFAAMEEEQPERALKAFFEAAKMFHRVAVPPHKDTHLAEIAASACMADEGTVYPLDPFSPEALHAR